MPPELQSDNIRSAIESAIEQQPVEEGNLAGPAEGASPSASPAAPAAPEGQQTEGTPVAKEEKAAAPPPPTGTEAKPTDTPTPTQAPAPEGRELKAPGTWTPAAREKWNALDSEVRSEIWRREREVSRALTNSQRARQFQDEFVEACSPFMGFIAAENSTPIQAMVNMFQTAAALRVGTPQQKVQIAADIIRQFNIDLGALDSVLAGQSPQFNPQMAIQQEINKALQPFHQQHQQWQQRLRAQDEQLDAEVDDELMQFATQHEFYEDVKDVMADLIEVAMNRGHTLGLTEAYERATLLVEPVRRVIEGRKQTEAARAANAKARQARNAAGSITPSVEATTAQPVPGDSVRSALEFAIAQQQGR